MEGPRVYRGTDARSRVASALAGRARGRRHETFFPLTGVRPGHRVVDLGCGSAGLPALEPDLDVTGVDRVPRPEYPGPFVVADVTRPLPFADEEFDLAYASSLIEHLPREARPAFAAEVRRVARGFYVQTPAFSFPVEPHALLPVVHWLPAGPRRRLWGLGVGGDPDDRLLRRGELARLFGVEPLAERVGPLAKSWIALRAVDAGG